MCSFSSSNKRRQSPRHLPKSSGTRSELRKAGLKHMFQARMRRLFPPGSEFVQESDLLSCFQDLRHGGAPQGFELVSSTQGEWYGGRGRPDSECMCVHFPLEVVTQKARPRGLCPLLLSHSGFISCRSLSVARVSQVCEWEPEFNVFFLVLFFPQLNSLGNHILPLAQNWF